MNLTEQEKRKIAFDYLDELAKKKESTKVSSNIDTDENEIRNKKFLILYRAFYEDIYMPELRKIKGLKEYNMSDYNIRLNRLTNKKQKFWQDFRDLRNKIMHIGYTKSSDFCYISKEALNAFENEVYKYLNPPSAFDICTKNPYQITDEDIISDVLTEMKENNYTNAPVIDEKKIYKRYV